MVAVTRPLAAATAALLGAGMIAAAPALTSAAPALPRISAPEIALQASILDILGFPVYQQAITNEVEFVAIRAAGFAEGGAGLVESLVALPAALITATQQTLSGDALDALTTLEDWVIGTGSATLVPPVLANIEVGQIQLAIQAALLLAQPTAFVQLGSGLYTAFDTIARSFIIAGQDLVNAVLSFNIGGIVEAVVDGVAGVIEGFATGGQAIIDGVAAAQTTLVTALQARPVLQPQPLAARSAAAEAPVQIAPAPAEIAAAPAEVGAAVAPTTAGVRAAGDEAGQRTAGGSRAAAGQRDNATAGEGTDQNADTGKSGSRRAAAR